MSEPAGEQPRTHAVGTTETQADSQAETGAPACDPGAPAAPAADDAALASWLAAHDEPCPVCDHNLRGTRDPRCPECGSPIRLGVASDNARPGPWLLAFFSCTLALGFDAVATLLFSIPAVVSLFVAGGPPLELFMVLGMMASLSLAMGAANVVLHRRQRAWRRLARTTQWKAAWGIFAGVGSLHLAAGAVAVLWIV